MVANSKGVVFNKVNMVTIIHKHLPCCVMLNSSLLLLAQLEALHRYIPAYAFVKFEMLNKLVTTYSNPFLSTLVSMTKLSSRSGVVQFTNGISLPLTTQYNNTLLILKGISTSANPPTLISYRSILILFVNSKVMLITGGTTQKKKK